MEQMRKIVILAMIIAAGGLAYFGMQRYQSHHAENVKIQVTNPTCATCPKCPENGCPPGESCTSGQAYQQTGCRACVPKYCAQIGAAQPG